MSKHGIKMAALTGALAGALALTGCASVDMAQPEASSAAKSFKQPPKGKSGLYVYRESSFGSGVTKDLFINGECLGKSAPKVFFYKELEGKRTYTLSTESEFSPNSIQLTTVPGKNHFVRQYITMGLMVGGAKLEVVSEEVGKAAIAQLNMAAPGNCQEGKPMFESNNNTP